LGEGTKDIELGFIPSLHTGECTLTDKQASLHVKKKERGERREGGGRG
jgi:hypothetical protein